MAALTKRQRLRSGNWGRDLFLRSLAVTLTVIIGCANPNDVLGWPQADGAVDVSGLGAQEQAAYAQEMAAKKKRLEVLTGELDKASAELTRVQALADTEAALPGLRAEYDKQVAAQTAADAALMAAQNAVTDATDPAVKTAAEAKLAEAKTAQEAVVAELTKAKTALEASTASSQKVFTARTELAAATAAKAKAEADLVPLKAAAKMAAEKAVAEGATDAEKAAAKAADEAVVAAEAALKEINVLVGASETKLAQTWFDLDAPSKDLRVLSEAVKAATAAETAAKAELAKAQAAVTSAAAAEKAAATAKVQELTTGLGKLTAARSDAQVQLTAKLATASPESKSLFKLESDLNTGADTKVLVEKEVATAKTAADAAKIKAEAAGATDQDKQNAAATAAKLKSAEEKLAGWNTAYLKAHQLVTAALIKQEPQLGIGALVAAATEAKAAREAEHKRELETTIVILSNRAGASPAAPVSKAITDAQKIADKKMELTQADVNKLSAIVTSIDVEQAEKLSKILETLEAEAPDALKATVDSLYRIARRKGRTTRPAAVTDAKNDVQVYLQHYVKAEVVVYPESYPAVVHYVAQSVDGKAVGKFIPLSVPGTGKVTITTAGGKNTAAFVADDKSPCLTLTSATNEIPVLQPLVVPSQKSKAMVIPKTSVLIHAKKPYPVGGSKLFEFSYKADAEGAPAKWELSSKPIKEGMASHSAPKFPMVASHSSVNAHSENVPLGFALPASLASLPVANLSSLLLMQVADAEPAQPTTEDGAAGGANSTDVVQNLLDTPPRFLKEGSAVADSPLATEEDWKDTVSDLKKQAKPAVKCTPALDLALTCKVAYLTSNDETEKAFEKLRADYFFSLSRNLSTQVSESPNPEVSDLNIVRDVYRELQSLRSDLEKLEFETRLKSSIPDYIPKTVPGIGGGGGAGGFEWSGKTQVIEVYRKETYCVNGADGKPLICTRYVPFTIEVPVVDRSARPAAPTKSDVEMMPAPPPALDFESSDLAPAA